MGVNQYWRGAVNQEKCSIAESNQFDCSELVFEETDNLLEDDAHLKIGAHAVTEVALLALAATEVKILSELRNIEDISKLPKLQKIMRFATEKVRFLKDHTYSKKLIKFFKAEETVIGERIARKNFPQNVSFEKVNITFETSHQKGRFGDRLTHKHYTARGYKKLESKVSTIHGIDAVYYNEGTGEVLLVENKTDTAKLLNLRCGQSLPVKQMSDICVSHLVEKLRNSKNPAHQKTAEIILNAQRNGNAKKVLVNHNLSNGKLTAYNLSADATEKKFLYEINQSKSIEQEITSLCNNGKLKCVPVPT
jgi:hypothetical protein